MIRFATSMALTLLLAACGSATAPEPAPPQTLILTTCTANVPVTDVADGDTACTPIVITLADD